MSTLTYTEFQTLSGSNMPEGVFDSLSGVWERELMMSLCLEDTPAGTDLDVWKALLADFVKAKYAQSLIDGKQSTVSTASVSNFSYSETPGDLTPMESFYRSANTWLAYFNQCVLDGFRTQTRKQVLP